MKLSVVVPAYNEASGIKQFHDTLLTPALKNIHGYTFDIIYINDGSEDNTLGELKKLAKKSSNIQVINLSRNFGKEIAITAGLNIAPGEATIILDSDGQHPPELIEKFIAKWRDGAQVVVGIRSSNQKEGLVKKYGSKIFYSLFNSMSGATITPRSTDFRLIDKQVRSAFNEFTERNRITRGLIDWLGFKREYIEFDAPARLAGDPTYSTNQLIKLAFHSFISLSLKPLYFFGWLGVLITSLSLGGGLFLLIEQVVLGDPLSLGITGAVLVGIFVAFLTGLILTSQGVLAVYLSHVFAQTQGRPLFVIDYSTSVLKRKKN